MDRTKSRITDLDSRINAGAGDADPLENLRSATVGAALGCVLASAVLDEKVGALEADL
jgi:hypothetical protein